MKESTLPSRLGWRRSITTIEKEIPFIGSWRLVGFFALFAGLVAIYLSAGNNSYARILVAVICAYIVGSLGFNLLLGVAGQFAFGQAGFMAVAAFSYAVLASWHVPLWLSALIAVALSAVSGALLGLAVMRAAYIYLGLVTLAFAEAVVLGVQRWPAAGGEDGIRSMLAGRNTVFIALIAVVVVVAVFDRIVRSRLGRAMLMTRSNTAVAQSMGVNHRRLKVTAFTVGSGVTGLGGVLLAGGLGFISPANFSLHLTILMLTMVVVGGLGSLWGSVFGTLIIVGIEETLTNYPGFSDVTYGILLWVTLALLPGGLVSLRYLIPRLTARFRKAGTGDA